MAMDADHYHRSSNRVTSSCFNELHQNHVLSSWHLQIQYSWQLACSIFNLTVFSELSAFSFSGKRAWQPPVPRLLSELNGCVVSDLWIAIMDGIRIRSISSFFRSDHGLQHRDMMNGSPSKGSRSQTLFICILGITSKWILALKYR